MIDYIILIKKNLNFKYFPNNLNNYMYVYTCRMLSVIVLK